MAKMTSSKSFSTSLKTADQQASSVAKQDQFMQFSKDPIMENFGSLPFGKIPEPLKYVRPFHDTTLSNGIRVCTEPSQGQTAYVSVYVGAGSRNEDLSSTGSAYLLQRMAERGNSSRSKTEISEEIENMGARYEARTDREYTSYSMQVFGGDVHKALNMLGGMVSNSNFNTAEVEMCKEEISHEHEDNHNRYKETLIENVHFNAYREHMMGQPIKGDRDLTQTLTVEQLNDFHTSNYFGDNITVVATGNVNHEQVVDCVQNHFNSIPKSVSVETKGTEKPIFIPALLMIRDDEMVNSNVGVFYDAPSAKHEDYYSFLLLKHMFGQYRID